MFQKKIVEKYLSKLDKELLEQKYDLFCSIFKNEKKIENIRNSKEEQYQEGFIRDLFVSVLGYTIKPEENYNILTELKNEVANKSNSKKSDGAICEENNENKIRAVIELKGTDTTDLDKVAFQAFSYKNFHNECNYVIVSNFERLRIYVETQIEFEEFNLFTLSFERFCILYLLLELNQLKADIPLKLKHETLSEEKQITDNFYADYSTFKRLLFEDLCENNLQSEECHAELVSASDDEIPNQVRNDDGKINKLLLFKKTQKLLDRILFILFCEDRNLLPPNSIAGIISDYQKLKEMGYGQPLYNVFKTYFDRIDKGYKNESDSSKDVFAYNGGLFKTDEVLDSIKVGDHVLYIHSKRLADYDFESQISVDILGRIFENSLTEIEEVQKEIEAEKTGAKVENNNVGKRKKDGVFYTPEYITKYIVENTIGKLCEDKRNELNINDREYNFQNKYTKSKATELEQRLEQYRAWLLDLKILDPACGSGAFLNAALHQLKVEHTLVDYYWSTIRNGELNFTEIENTILENNLYGVDINEESVEIAKLSLWLHTAKKNRKLTTLNGKIKCGNSLIDDPTVADEKAFKWEEEFPEVFAKGGFDVVIGNPPYVFDREKFTEEEKSFYETNYVSAKYQANLYILFIEKFQKLLNKNGLCGVIVPNSWLMVYSGEDLRKYLYENVSLMKIANLSGKSFSDANVETVILIDENKKPDENTECEIYKNDEGKTSFEFSHKLKQFDFGKNKGLEFTVFKTEENSILIDKIKTDSLDLDVVASVKAGLQAYEKGKGTPKQTEEDVKNRPYDYTYRFDDETYKYLDGSNVLRYGIIWSGLWLKYGNHLAAPRSFDLFSGEKIIIREITGKFPKCINATYSNEIYLYNRSNIAVIKRDDNYSLKYILTILNSSLMSFYFKKNTAKAERKLFPKIILNDLRLFPIKKAKLEAQQPFINLADRMLTLNETLQKKSTNFLKVVKQTFALEKVSAKMESFYELDFDGFVKELKQKITPKLKLEWLEVFEETKKELQDLKQQIDSTDKEINRLVYKLYGLTEEEIKIVEGR